MFQVQCNDETKQLRITFDPEVVMLVVACKPPEGKGKQWLSSTFTPETEPPMCIEVAAHLMATMTRAVATGYGIPLDDLLEKIAATAMGKSITKVKGQ